MFCSVQLNIADGKHFPKKILNYKVSKHQIKLLIIIGVVISRLTYLLIGCVFSLIFLVSS